MKSIQNSLLDHIRHGFLAAMTAGTLLAAGAAQAEDSGVVTSIRPLGMIAAALTEGVVEPRVLLQDGASPHHYAMKPSDMRALDNARVVVWVGPELERFLAKPLERAGVPQVVLQPGDHEAAEAAELHEDEHDQVHGHEHEHDERLAEKDHDPEEEHEGHEHDHGGLDVHPWLDPMTGLEVAHQMLPHLIEAYPEQESRLNANFERFEASLIDADRTIREMLDPLKERGFFVFHDAYTGFVGHYGLKQLGYFTIDPARKPGARHLAEIRESLENEQAACVMTEPQFSSALVERVTNGLPLKTQEIDPLAAGVALNDTAYVDYLLDLAGRFQGCLTP